MSYCPANGTFRVIEPSLLPLIMSLTSPSATSASPVIVHPQFASPNHALLRHARMSRLRNMPVMAPGEFEDTMRVTEAFALLIRDRPLFMFHSTSYRTSLMAHTVWNRLRDCGIDLIDMRAVTWLDSETKQITNERMTKALDAVVEFAEMDCDGEPFGLFVTHGPDIEDFLKAVMPHGAVKNCHMHARHFHLK
jgi:hypothetical protein